MNFERDDRGIYFLGAYHKYWINKKDKIKNEDFDQHSKKLLDFKEAQRYTIGYFSKIILEGIDKSKIYAVVCIPPHKPGNLNFSEVLVNDLCSKNSNFINGNGCLVRIKEIDKKATGGNRDESVDLESIILKNSEVLLNHDILLIDDVTTSGNTFSACKKIIKKSGVNYGAIFCLALGKTANITTYEEILF